MKPETRWPLNSGHGLGLAVAARHHHLDLGADLPEFGKRLLTAHVGHAQIEHDQRDVAGVSLEHVDGRQSAVRQQNRVAVTFQGPFRHLPHELFIIHHQDHPAPWSAALRAAAGRSAAARSAAGNSTVKQLPLPGALLTVIAPLWPRRMPATAASPSPRPVNLVEKKGSKILALVASSMPQPVSRTSRQTYFPGRSSAASGWSRMYRSSTSLDAGPD